MLEFKDVSFSFGENKVLSDISFQCQKGEITAIVGQNGCGKTTLLKNALGMLKPDKGSIFINEAPLEGLASSERAKRLCYLSQGKDLPDITAGRMVLHGRFPYLSYPRRYSEKDIALAREAMEKMGIADLFDTPLSELSGGMRQKVYIALCLCQQADIILLDEPTTYLDIGVQLQLFDILKQLAKEGKTIVIVLHDILLALKYADKLASIKDGELIHFGSRDTFLQEGIPKRLFGLEIGSVAAEEGYEYYYKDGLNK